MKRIGNLLRRALLFGVTGFVTVMVAACYGMAYTFRMGGRVVDRVTGDPVPGIQVKCVGESGTDMATTLSDEQGNWTIEVYGAPDEAPGARCQFEDVDGDANGGKHAEVVRPARDLKPGEVIPMAR